MKSRFKVKRKQPNSKMCLVCGLQNPMGLKASFYELENHEVVGYFEPLQEHQGYPDRLHGGIIAAILDEAIERAVMIDNNEDSWGVTVEFSVRYKKPIPLDEPLRVRARVIKETGRFYDGSSELLLQNGIVAATGSGRFLKVSQDKFSDYDDLLEWKVTPAESDPEEVEL